MTDKIRSDQMCLHNLSWNCNT